jgi:hypothetical protein
MTFLMASNSLIGFNEIVPGQLFNSTTVFAGFRDDTYTNSAIDSEHTSAILTHTLDTPIADAWFHFELGGGGSSAASDADAAPCTISGPTNDLMRILCTNAVAQGQYWNGAAWVNFGSTYTINLDTCTRLDFHVKLDNATGLFEWYANDALIASFSGDTILSTDSTVSRFAVRTPQATSSGWNAYFSQFIIADESTVGCKVFQHTLTADGANTGWDGPGFAGYNMGVRSLPQVDTAIYTGTANAIETAVVDNLLATGLYIRGVAVNVAARRSGAGLTKVDPVLRSGGTNYFGTEKSIGYGNTHARHIWTTDPATAAAWDSTGVNQIEAGVRAKA